MIVVAVALFIADWSLQVRAAEVVGAGGGWSFWHARGVLVGLLVLGLSVVGFLEYARLVAAAAPSAQAAAGPGLAPAPAPVADAAATPSAAAGGRQPSELMLITGLVATCAMATAPIWWQLAMHQSPSGSGMLAALGWVMAFVFASAMVRRTAQGALRRLAMTMLGVVYLGVCAAVILSVRVDFGVPMLVIFVAAVKCADIGAYFAGSAFGQHKLIPWLSPGKSWEGLAGGVAAAVVVSVALRLAFWTDANVERLGVLEAAAFGLAMGLVGQFGDLCESLLKRSAEVKDSGALVPSFGGVLDIVDSLLVAAPVAYGLLAAMA